MSSNFLIPFKLDFKYHILKSPESFNNYIENKTKVNYFGTVKKKCGHPQMLRTESSES